MESPPDLIAAYAVLGVSRSATRDEVGAAFRARASLVHPDLHQHRSVEAERAAGAAMRQLNEAHELVVRHLDQTPPTRVNPEVFYSLVEWPRHERRLLAAVLSEINIPFYWEDADIIVDERREQVVDLLVAAIDAAASVCIDDAAPINEDRITAFSLRGWTRSAAELLPLVLQDLGVPSRLDGLDVVVDERYELPVRLLAAALGPQKA